MMENGRSSGKKNGRNKVRKMITFVLYGTLLLAIAWQGAAILLHFRPQLTMGDSKNIRITVQGNVRRPGMYRVPEGTTQFEILQVAGVRSTSDLSSFLLHNQVESDTAIDVGTLDEPVRLLSEQPSVRLEFYYGDINLIGSDGGSIPLQEGVILNQGDRIQTEASAQAELSFGEFSRIDVDNFSEVLFDKTGVKENDKNIYEVFHRSGIAWHKIVYSGDKEKYTVTTPLAKMVVGGSGADFITDIQNDQITINNIDGLILVERIDGDEAINLISGQSVTIYNDARPFQVTQLSADLRPQEQFSKLNEQKAVFVARHMPLNFLFCGVPASFYVYSARFREGKVYVVHLPAETIVEQFAHGFSTLDQAFLYGGPVYVSTLIERILNLQVPKHCIFEKEDIRRTSDILGGVTVEIDDKAATAMQLSKGTATLSGKQLTRFLSPVISGPLDAKMREEKVLKGLFAKVRQKSVIPTMLMAEQVLGNIETNMTASEALKQYAKFSKTENWEFKNFELPTRQIRRNRRTQYDPIMEKCRTLLAEN